MRVNVTRADINKGCPESVHFCPIARAVRRKGYKRVSVGNTICIGQYGHGLREFDLPYTAMNFVDNFDAGEVVKPFSFTAVEL